MFDEIKSMITKKFKEHKETFDPGMLTIKLSFTCTFPILEHVHIHM
jgi:hypothetical protein